MGKKVDHAPRHCALGLITNSNSADMTLHTGRMPYAHVCDTSNTNGCAQWALPTQTASRTQRVAAMQPHRLIPAIHRNGDLRAPEKDFVEASSRAGLHNARYRGRFTACIGMHRGRCIFGWVALYGGACHYSMQECLGLRVLLSLLLKKPMCPGQNCGSCR